MSELQEITTTDLEEKISPDNDSIILSEKDDDSDFEDDSISMPGDENIIRIPPRPVIGSENYVIENNNPENSIVYERDQIANTDDEEDDEDDDEDNDDIEDDDAKQKNGEDEEISYENYRINTFMDEFYSLQ